MSLLKCTGCGADLAPEARFCRQCGASVTPNMTTDSSELPTATFDKTDDIVTTKRLKPRPTSSDPRSLKASAAESISPNVSRWRGPAKWISGAVLLAIMIGVVASVSHRMNQSRSQVSDSSDLVYPGSQTIVDMQGDIDRAIQLKTSDSFDKVVAWYEASLKPTKTIRLTSTNVVLKNQNVTATIATENDKTNILIKQSLKR